MLEVAEGIKSRLAAAGVTIGGGVYYNIAPKGVAYPYGLIDFVAGGDENFTEVDTRNELWQVKVVHNSASGARTLQNSIKAALHKQEENVTVTGYDVMWCRAEKPFAFSEDVGDQTIYHRGHTYRIRIHEVEG